MAYSRYYSEGWKNNSDGNTPITAAALNHMEEGIVGALQKSGDTMTGMIRHASDIDYDTTPATSETSEVLQALDADGHVRFRIYQGVNPNGTKFLYLMSRDDDGAGGLSDYNQLGVGLTANGEPVFALSASGGDSVKAFRSAIGLGASGGSLPIQISQGGTGLTSNPSLLINLGSTSAANVMQTSPRPGVTGILTVAHGGTGLSANPSMLVNLGSTSAASVLQTSPRPGVSGVLPVANGGTGANTPAGARANIDAVQLIDMSTNTWADINTKLNIDLALSIPAVFKASSEVASKLSDGKITAAIVGMVNRNGSGVLTFDARNISAVAYCYQWSITNLTSSGASVGTVYRFTGTAM